MVTLNAETCSKLTLQVDTLELFMEFKDLSNYLMKTFIDVIVSSMVHENEELRIRALNVLL